MTRPRHAVDGDLREIGTQMLMTLFLMPIEIASTFFGCAAPDVMAITVRSDTIRCDTIRDETIRDETRRDDT